MHSASALKRDFDDISDSQDELAGSACRLDDSGGESAPPPVAMEHDKRIRREIANSNERRRMQSINAGFQTLRSLLPQHEGEKLSKAAILQQTSDFIYSLEQEKTRLLTQNCQLKRLLGQQQQQTASDSDAASATDSPSTHRNASRESAEAAGAPEEPTVPPPLPPLVSAQEEEAAVIRQELQELRGQLEQERRHRLLTEDRLRLAEAPPPPPAVYQERLHGGHAPLLKKPKMEALESEPERAESPCLAGAGQVVMEPQTVLPTLLMDGVGMPQPAQTEPPPQPAVHAPHRQMYMGSATSRQNLDTIVEAIRHLEGDHLFEDLETAPEPALEVEARLEQPEPQEAPLELTTHDRASAGDPYRPGVIVAQHQQQHQQHQHHHLVHQQHHQHHLQS